MFFKFFIFILILVVCTLFFSCPYAIADSKNRTSKTILIGASIGHGWKFHELPKRIELNNQIFEFYGCYTPDKSKTLDQVLMKTEPGNAVILKQCAAYFKVYEGRNYNEMLSSFQQNMRRWVRLLAKERVEPVLATVVPITNDLLFKYKIRYYIKKYIFFRDPPKLDRIQTNKQINLFNEWIRTFAQENNLRVLDLEKTLRISDTNRMLRPELSTDGLHLNDIGYKELDKLAEVFFKNME
jgi:hypothetical protein